MRIDLRAWLACLAACGALVATVAFAHHGHGARTALPEGPYVALGDSYTSGPGIPQQTGDPAGCARSDQGYPAQVARSLKLPAADFRDVSCSGATLGDLTGPQTTNDGVNPAQLAALSGATRLVTLGIGGNDAGFSSLITRCVETGAGYYLGGRLLGTGESPCWRQYVGADGTDEVRQKIQDVGDRLDTALQEIKRRAPQARVYVVGYPEMLPYRDTSCALRMGLAPGDMTFLHHEEQELNTVLRHQAEAAGARYVDTYAPSGGHDACTAEDTRWIEPLAATAPAAPLHPNERGERGMAGAVIASMLSAK
jgi:lysophospholipase L1-like esterase